MNEDEQLIIYLTIESTEETLVPSLLPYLEHKYKYGNSEEAVSVLSDLFNGLVKEHGIGRILRGDNPAIWKADDIAQAKLTYAFWSYELAENALEELKRSQ